ncbi:MAG TPA: MtrAB system histidine kinase MtrB [Mycobacteriales bacterium]|nr:MtrAB system histidine kinase MtrB [Mycobacteriales bacterium]HWB67779.1 MtrAB system histidine kinase MtrB [Mycobacteriales bacterium]
MKATPLAAGRAVRHRWRASLQTRVVATTLILSATVSVGIGATILHQVRSGLLGSATRAAQSELGTGVERARDQFLALPDDNPNAVERTAYAVVTQLSGEQGDYDVVMLAANGGLASYGPEDAVLSIPASLRTAVAKSGREAWAYVRLRSGSSHGAGLAIGAPVQAGAVRYQLYYLFPLNREAATLRLVERTMLFAGAALVLLLVGIAAVVTREVVRPVRQAAATAERLAAGRLKERMQIRGEDDLATLAASFNRMADTLQQQISQLREMSRLQRRFVADVSHELRTPITTIRMAADVLHDSSDALPPELTRSSELLQAQLDRFESLLADLLEISRYDAGAALLEAEPIDLVQLVSRVIALATPLSDRRQAPIEADLPAEPVVVDVDARRIDRVLRNLVTNALEHGEGRPVTVRLRADDGGVAVTVRDRGVGLRPGDASLVFGRFWRADPARARTTGGTGLGLSIALEDVRLHGGWLQAWGEPDRGSVFRMTLPWQAGGTIVASPLPLEPDDATDELAPPAAPIAR